MSAQAMVFPSTTVGLPKEVQYDLPPQMENSSRSYTAHVSPDGITQVQGAVPSATAFVANSGGFAGAAFGQQNVSCTLPSG